MRVGLICLLCLTSWGAARGQSPDIIERARRSVVAAFPPLSAADPAIAPLGERATTALGCRLVAGLPLAAPITVYRLDFPLDGAPLALHVSADGSMTQPCDQRYPNLGAGVQPIFRARADSDGDGFSDSDDACPWAAGIFAPERPGCPLRSDRDRDGDGTPDERDLCPGQAGAASANGCSLMRDEDGDGAPDHVDVCRSDFGPIRDDLALGCPADGSGSSARRRGSDERCLAEGDAPVFASRSADAEIIGMLKDAPDRAVSGRTADNNWLRLANGWVERGDLRLAGACFNIPLVNPSPGGATGCFLRARGDYAKVRQAPAGRQVARITSEKSYAALGANAQANWLFFREGWVNRGVLEFSGNCDQLPTLDPTKVASGVIHFCPPDYAGFLRPRITIGERNARVASPDIANRLRAAPTVSAEQIGEIPPRARLDAVLDGPACHDAQVWWQVAYAGQVGWTVESDLNFNFYYLAPVAGAASSSAPSARAPSMREQPASARLIHSGSLATLDTVRSLSLESARAIAWSPAGKSLAAIYGEGELMLFQPSLSSKGTRLELPGASPPSAIAFRADGRRIAIGSSDGGLSVYDIGPQAKAALSYSLEPLAGPIRAIAFSRAGDRLAAISGDPGLKLARKAGSLKLWALNPSAPAEHELVLHFRFPYPLTAAVISADDRLLAVTGESLPDRRGGLWVYRLSDGELLHSTALIPMAGGARVIASPGRALGDFVYNNGDSLYQLEVESGEDRRVYHQAGERLPYFAFRRQVLPQAEALLAVVTVARDGGSRLRIVNALNRYGPAATLAAAPGAIAFSPDGRALALAQGERLLVLGATAG